MNYNFLLNKQETTKQTKPIKPAKTDYSFLLKKEPITPKKVEPEDIETRTLSDFLGGGTYKMSTKDPNANIATPRTNYGGLPTKEGYERADIFPVSLSGVNASPKNITYEPFLPSVKKAQQEGKELPVIKTKTDKYLINEILPKYKSGEMSLREAQVNTVSFLRNEQEGLSKKMENINLGGAFGELSDKVVGFFKGIQNKSKEQLNTDLKNIAQTEARIKQEAEAKKIEEKSLTPSQKIQKSDPLFVNTAKTASEVLGREIKPENILSEYEKLNPDDKRLVDTKVNEQTIEGLAQVATAPVRFTAGSLASALTSYSLERANSNLKFTPKTDAEKLIIGENEIQRLTKQEDLYGTIARGAGVPVALATIAILENPFLKSTGTSKVIKEAVERQLAKQGEKMLAKLGTEQIIKIADDVIKAETKAGRIANQEAIKVSEAINGIKIKPLEPQIKPQEAGGEVLMPKTTKPLVPSETAKINPLNFKTAEDYLNSLPTEPTIKTGKPVTLKSYHGTDKKFDEFKITEKGVRYSGDGVYFTPSESAAKYFAGDNGRVIESAISFKKPYVSYLPEGNSDFQYSKSFIDNLKSKGYDGMIVKMRDTDTLTGKVDSEWINEIVSFNPKNIKTKSQLISEWEKAQKTTLPKPKPIKYVPEEKPVDLRKRITTERLIEEPSVPNRIKNETIEKGLQADFGGISDYDKVSFKDQAKLVGDIIDENPAQAINIALGKELPKNGALPESVFMAVKNQAIKNGDTELLVRLATEEGGVAKESTILGQRIKMLDEQLEDDAFRNINEVVKNRQKNFKGNIVEAKSKEVSKIKGEITKLKPKVDEWLAFVSEITC